MRSDAQVVELFEFWLADCASYDRDPVDFRRKRGLAAIKVFQAEQPARARPYAEALVRQGVLTPEEAEQALLGHA